MQQPHLIFFPSPHELCSCHHNKTKVHLCPLVWSPKLELKPLFNRGGRSQRHGFPRSLATARLAGHPMKVFHPWQPEEPRQWMMGFSSAGEMPQPVGTFPVGKPLRLHAGDQLRKWLVSFTWWYFSKKKKKGWGWLQAYWPAAAKQEVCSSSSCWGCPAFSNWSGNKLAVTSSQLLTPDGREMDKRLFWLLIHSSQPQSISKFFSFTSMIKKLGTLPALPQQKQSKWFGLQPRGFAGNIAILVFKELKGERSGRIC